MGKYNPDNLLPALRLFVDARNKALETGFTDNGGAIHSVERILDILSINICYPHLSHINNLKSDTNAEISNNAHAARERGEVVLIEHVLPQRAYARTIIELVGQGASNDDLVQFIKDNYRLVLLTTVETTALNRINRSSISKTRLSDAGIVLYETQST